MDHAPATTNAARRIAPSAFWTWTGAGVLAMAVAWLWLGLSIVEEASEQGKAEAAGTSMAGFTATVGAGPLAFAHLLGFARHGSRGDTGGHLNRRIRSMQRSLTAAADTSDSSAKTAHQTEPA